MKVFNGTHRLAYQTIFGVVSIEIVGNVFGFKLHSDTCIKLRNPRLELLDRIYSREYDAIDYLINLERIYKIDILAALEAAGL